MPCLPRVHPALPDATHMVSSVKLGVTFPPSFQTTSQGEPGPPMGRAELRQRGVVLRVCVHTQPDLLRDFPTSGLCILFENFLRASRNYLITKITLGILREVDPGFTEIGIYTLLKAFLGKKKYTIMSTKLETEMDAYSE